MTIKSKFKQTEIGMIPEDWEIICLGSEIEIIGGGTPKTSNSDYWDGNISWISVTDFGDSRWIHQTEKHITEKGLNESSTKILHKGQIIISARGTVGEVRQIKKDMAFNQSCYGIDGKNKINNDFLYSLLNYKVKTLQGQGHGAVFNTITRDTFDNIYTAIPKKIEQSAIAKILSDLDSKIELNRKINKSLEELSQAIFKKWFVDFEFPNEKGKPYKSSGGEMMESELGEIPKGWSIRNLGDLVYHLKPGTNYQPNRVERGIPFVNVKNVQNGFLVLNDVKYITKEEYARVHKYWAPEEHDLLITRIGTLGNVGVIRKKDLPVAVHYNSIDIKAKMTSFQFLYFILKSDFFQSQYHTKKKQSVQEYVTIDEVEKLKIILPMPISKLENIFISLFNEIEKNFAEIQTISQIRDSLLPRLMSGKIRVPVEVRT